MKKISPKKITLGVLCLTIFPFLFSCGYFENKTTNNNENNEKINIDTFLGIEKDDELNNGQKLPDDNEINDNFENNNKINSDTEIDNIENINLEIEEILTNDSDEEIDILEETTEEYIEELIDILFDTSE